uniref:Uncharacterized protein n=1 Tax=Ammonifex degensii TaxID=42838 RepID=A0A7C2I1M2_9THEO
MKGKAPFEVPAEVLDAVRRAAPEKRITCARAHELAGELKVPVRLIGAACEALGIKIKECQLGCF